MYRATTPTHTFTLPFEADTITECVLTYSQRGRAILEKNLGDMTPTENKLIVQLTQEEANLFCEDAVYIQLRVKLTNGKVLASRMVNANVLDVLNAEVI